MDNELKNSILRTLAYFDIFDFPLTKEEVYRFFWNYRNTITFFDFIKQLEHFEHVQQIEHKNGFYFLSGREEIINNRQRSVPIIEKKLKIAKRAAKKVRWIPFVRALFVCNTVASSSASKESDIDVFIVIKKGRLWLSRFLITFILSLFKLRRTKTNIKNKICLSFYVTDDHLNLEDIAVTQITHPPAPSLEKRGGERQTGEPDIYLMYWIDQLVPIYDPENVREDIMASNQWVKNNLPNALQGYEMLSKYRVDNFKLQKFIRKLFEKMWSGGYGDILEREAKKIQEKKMARNYESVKDEPDTRVVISDTMLKFHENDRRRFFRERWKSRCEEIKDL